jgi:hypothetical protein
MKTMQANRTETLNVIRAFQREGKSYGQIARLLNRMDYVTFYGKRIKASDVQTSFILTRQRRKHAQKLFLAMCPRSSQKPLLHSQKCVKYLLLI